MSKRATAGLLQKLLQKAQRPTGTSTMRYPHLTPAAAAAASAIAASSSLSTACAFIPSHVTFSHNRSPHQHLPYERQHHQHAATRSSISRRYLHAQPETDGIIQGDEAGGLTSSSYATTYHAPVMATECINAMLGIGLDDKEKKMKGKNKKKQKKMRKKDRKLAMKEEDSDCANGSDAASSDALSQIVAHTATQPIDRPPMLFVDGTLGGGGHSEALLERCRSGDIVFGCDVDPSALSTASERLQRYTRSADTGRNDDDNDDDHLPLFVPVQSNFRDLADILPTVKHPVTGRRIMALPTEENEEEEEDGSDGDDAHFTGVDGMLLDLGVSSHQIDNADRGFAFMKDGPLDMRMWGGSWSDVGSESVGENAATKARGLNAADICNEFDEAELTRILRVYGDEPRARKIAAAIVDARPLATTSDLVNAVSSVVPEFAKKGRRMGRTATLARVFQSLRIVVNQEDKALVDVFEHAAPKLVRPGGRLVVLSYHSMEDRATKRVLRDGSVRGIRPGAAIERDIYGNVVGQDRPWKPLGKKRKASDEEIEVNSRARSATLRIGERQY